MAPPLRIEGAAELKKALAELPKATARNVQQRVLLKHAQPMVETAKALAPARPHGGKLRASITATTKRPRGYKAPSSRAFAYTRATGGSAAQARAAAAAVGTAPVLVFIGPGRLGRAIWNEFGTVKMRPQPYLRPAWDAHKRTMLNGVGRDMWIEIDKAAKRVAKKRAKRGP